MPAGSRPEPGPEPGAHTGRRCIVTGRVQGVFFRASTQHEAERLGVSGTARNLADGSVEVVVFGAAEAVAELCRWLGEGPPLARVEAVRCEPLAYRSAPPGFRIV